MKNLTCLLFVGLFFFACQTNESNSASQELKTPPVDNESATPEGTDQSLPFFNVKTETDDQGIPKSTLFLNIEGREVEIDKTLNCEVIDPKDYATHQIPENAVNACGGWWAGSGDYYYIFKQTGKTYWTVMKATNDEQQSGAQYVYNNFMDITFKRNK